MQKHVLPRPGRRAGQLAAATAIAAFVGLAPILSAARNASGLTTLYSFTGGADGANPNGAPTRDYAGNLYGTTMAGADNCPDSTIGCGTVWWLNTTGQLTALVTFLGARNGALPEGNLSLNGQVLHGTTTSGGKGGQGTLFRVENEGEGFARLHFFSGPDGANPETPPVLASHNNLFGTTLFGGTGWSGSGGGSGVLYEMAGRHGSVTVLHSFSGGADGAHPGQVFLDAAGNIIGETGELGSCPGHGTPIDCGTIYRFTPSTGEFQTLYTLTGRKDGTAPQIGGLDRKGDIWGTTVFGGENGAGTIFEMRPNGSGGYAFAHMYDFATIGDRLPNAPFVELDGTLVGTTAQGPVGPHYNGYGMLYKFRERTLTPLYAFQNDAHGGTPYGTPYVDKAGNVYGTTAYGGIKPCKTSGGTLIDGCGTVFEYTP